MQQASVMKPVTSEPTRDVSNTMSRTHPAHHELEAPPTRGVCMEATDAPQRNAVKNFLTV
jgi:hypothetical protein